MIKRLEHKEDHVHILIDVLKIGLVTEPEKLRIHDLDS